MYYCKNAEHWTSTAFVKPRQVMVVTSPGERTYKKLKGCGMILCEYSMIKWHGARKKKKHQIWQNCYRQLEVMPIFIVTCLSPLVDRDT